MQKFYTDIKNLLKTDINLLAYVRIKLDKPNDIVKLQMDIEDLYGFPERLIGSYRNEWLHYCLPQIQALMPPDISDENDFTRWIKTLDCHFNDTEIREMLVVIHQVETSQEKLVPFPTPLRTHVYNLLKI